MIKKRESFKKDPDIISTIYSVAPLFPQKPPIVPRAFPVRPSRATLPSLLHKTIPANPLNPAARHEQRIAVLRNKKTAAQRMAARFQGRITHQQGIVVRVLVRVRRYLDS
jgi:hypothetical protein